MISFKAIITILFILAALYAIYYLANKIYMYILDNKLIENPPKSVALKISLTSGVNNSSDIIQQIISNVYNQLPTDLQAKKDGKNKVRFVFHAKKGEKEQTTLVRFLVYIHPDLSKTMRDFLVQEFQGNALVKKIDDEPISFIVDKLKIS